MRRIRSNRIRPQYATLLCPCIIQLGDVDYGFQGYSLPYRVTLEGTSGSSDWMLFAP